MATLSTTWPVWPSTARDQTRLGTKQPRFGGCMDIATLAIPMSRSCSCAGCTRAPGSVPNSRACCSIWRPPGWSNTRWYCRVCRVLARLVARLRERANARLYRKLAALPSMEQRDRLIALLVVPAGSRRTTGSVAAPTNSAERGWTHRCAAHRAPVPGAPTPLRHLARDSKLLARYASTDRAQSIQSMPPERGIATLVAFACSLQASAQDDVLDVLDRLLTDLLARVDKQERQRRLHTIGDLDAAALLLRLIVLDWATSDHTVRGEIFARWPLERIEKAAQPSGHSLGRLKIARHPKRCSVAIAWSVRSCRCCWKRLVHMPRVAAGPRWRPGNSCTALSARAA